MEPERAETEKELEADTGTHDGFEFVVDGVDYQWPRPVVTGAEIMEAAGIPPSEGLVELLEDGTQRSVKPTDVFDLGRDRRFKKRPRFKRG